MLITANQAENLKNMAKNMSKTENLRLAKRLALPFLVVAFLPQIALASWNGKPYAQGETLDPQCLPQDSNCTIDIKGLYSVPGADTERSGGTSNPVNLFFKALPSPTIAPIVKSVTANSSGPNAGTHMYRMTYVTASGETGQSPVSETISVVNGHAKVVLSIPTDPNGVAIARNIYRTKANKVPLPLDYGQYFLIAENTISDNTSTVYIDTTNDEDLSSRWLSGRNTTAGGFYGNNTARPLFSVDPISGYMMIGQTPDLQAPFTQLDIAGHNMDIGTIGNLFVESNTTQGKDRGGQISIGGLYRSGGGAAIFANISGRKENAIDEDPRGYLSFATYGPEGAPAERARITSTGELLIGTTASMQSKIGVLNNINSDNLISLVNPNTGTSARSFLKISNTDGNASESVFFGLTGKNYGNVSGWQDQSMLMSGSGVKNGLRIFTSAGGFTVSSSGTSAPDLRIDQTTGKAGFGTTTPSGKLSLTQSSDSASGGLWIANSANKNFRSIYMNQSGTLSFYGGNSAGILNTATLNEAGTWMSASDITYKENITDLGEKYSLDQILSIKPRYYTMKGTGQPQIGFIAQELKLVVPEVVEGQDGSMGISYGNLAAILVQGIKDLNTKIDNMAKSTISGIKSLFVDEVTAKKGTFDELVSSQGVELKDRTTGQIYCLFINNGNIDKQLGTCSQQIANSSNVTSSAPVPAPAPAQTENIVTAESTQTPAETNSDTTTSSTEQNTNTPSTEVTTESTPADNSANTQTVAPATPADTVTVSSAPQTSSTDTTPPQTASI